MTTSQTPTPSIPTTGLIGLLTRLIRSDQPESTKRAVAILAASTLCLCAYALTLAIVAQAMLYKSVDGALAGVSIACNGTVVTLATLAYRKKESDGAAEPGKTDQVGGGEA